MRSPRRHVLAFVSLLATAVALSGCVRFQADLTVDADDTVDGTIVVAVIVGEREDGDTDAARDEAADDADRIEQELLPQLRGAAGVTREVYDQDGYFGSVFELRDAPLEAFSGGSESSLVLTRDGDEYVFSGRLDFSPDDASAAPEDADTSNIAVKLTFPGEVLSGNGEASGRTVTWNTSYEEGIDLDARASAIPSAPVWPWLAGGGALLLLALAAIVVVLRTRTRKLAS